MAEVICKAYSDPQFGKCISIANAVVELRVTLDFGPRIIYFACTGMENILWEDASRTTLGEKYELFDEQHILYGGHRLWIAPEIVPRCYHPDNLPVSFCSIENGARFTAAVERHNQIQKSISLSLDPSLPIVKIVHTIRNVGLWDIQLAPWAITMLAAGGLEVMPMPKRVSDLLPNRNFTFWEYSELNDKRIYFGKEFLTLVQDPAMEKAFKLGYNNESGWAAYFNRGQIFIKNFEPIIGGFYPDNGCCFESYTNGKFLEMESLGEIVELEPDDFVTLEEEWELYKADKATDPKDEAQLKEKLSQYGLCFL